MGDWHRIATWRQSPQERLAHDSFLADLDTHWQPTTSADRALNRRSQAVHLAARLFDGPESLAPIALSIAPVALSTALMAMAGEPKRAEYAGSPASWGLVLLTLGLAGLALQSALSPREVRPVPWSLFAAAPITVGSLAGALTVGRVLVPDKLVAAGYLLVAMGMGVLAVLPLVHGLANQRTFLRTGMVTAGLGTLLTVASNVVWTVLFSVEGEARWAVATALGSVSGLMSGLALVRARPPLAASSR